MKKRTLKDRLSLAWSRITCASPFSRAGAFQAGRSDRGTKATAACASAWILIHSRYTCSTNFPRSPVLIPAILPLAILPKPRTHPPLSRWLPPGTRTRLRNTSTFILLAPLALPLAAVPRPVHAPAVWLTLLSRLVFLGEQSGMLHPFQTYIRASIISNVYLFGAQSERPRS